MHLHSSSLDLEKFHAEFVPRSSLPADFGGSCDTVEVLHEKLCKDFLDMREHFMAEEKQATLRSEWLKQDGEKHHDAIATFIIGRSSLLNC